MNKMLILGVVSSISVVIGLVSIYFLGRDNPVEEACEEIIKDETGVDIDLTPGTPENAPAAKDETGNKAAS